MAFTKKKISGQVLAERYGLEARRISELIIEKGLRPWSQEGYQLFLDSPWANATERLHTVGAESFDPNSTDQALWLGNLARKALEWFYVESEVEALLKSSPATRAILKGMEAGEDDFNTVLTSYLGSVAPAGESDSGGLGAGPIEGNGKLHFNFAAVPVMEAMAAIKKHVAELQPPTMNSGKKETDGPQNKKHPNYQVTQEEAAKLCGVTSKTISNWEKGKGTPDGWPGRYIALNLKTWVLNREQTSRLKETALAMNRATPMDPSDMDQGEYKSAFDDE